MLEFRNLRAFTKVNKYKTKSKDFSITWLNLLNSLLRPKQRLIKRLGWPCIPSTVSGVLELQLNATARCNFLGKARKTMKCTCQKNLKAAIIVDQNRKPKTNLKKTRKPRKTTKTKTCSFKVPKPKNQTKDRLDPQNRKSQCPLLQRYTGVVGSGLLCEDA